MEGKGAEEEEGAERRGKGRYEKKGEEEDGEERKIEGR